MINPGCGNEYQVEIRGASSPSRLIPTDTQPSGTRPPAMATSSSPRPALKTQQSTSLPSTPNHRPFDHTSQTRSPSAKRNASNSTPTFYPPDSLAFPRRFNGGCKYETGMANAKRRVPYSLGPDKLEPDPEAPKAFLTPAEESRLTADMKDLYSRLLPSPASEERRRRLVEKLESILRTRWPSYAIKVNVFGSTGNKLGTTDSDVDICITTDCKELEHVCVLAEILAKQGMQRVVCVSVAKVPIVKIWDPDLRLACDLNVNNPVALENTEMIRAYVEIDERVRPLAMIVKHWTKRRVLNEAALGGTLSSYTWICMIINFLQTRNPPVLPALQQAPLLQEKLMSGLNVAFDKNVASYRSYGSSNKDSLGMLLFQFFRYYGHEVDFETSVMSVRAGRVITKWEKNWHFLQDNRLCVEEPFNTSRNLGNTADDTSVRGIHLELRRAFAMVSGGNLSRCCVEYEPPANLVDDGRPFEKQTPSVNRPTLAHPAAATLGRMVRGNSRGGRQNNQTHRGFNSARRASSASSRTHAFSQPLPLGNNNTNPAELTLQAQHQQHLLHDRLFQQYQILQAQEQELRAQLHQQAILQGRIMPTTAYPHFLLPHSAYTGGQEEVVRARAGAINQSPLSAPIRPHGFSFPLRYEPRTPVYGISTNPPSPMLPTAFPDARRSFRRFSMTTGSSGGSLRAQSQPPRPVPSPLSVPNSVDSQHVRIHDMSYHPGKGHASASGAAQEYLDPLSGHQGRLYPNSNPDRGGSEYIGYYLGHSPPLPMYSRSAVSSPLPGSAGLGIQNGGISPQVLAQLPPNPLSIHALSSDLARLHYREAEKASAEYTPELTVREAPKQAPKLRRSNSGPVVVNGSVNCKSALRPNSSDLYGSPNTAQFDASTSDEVAVDTPTSSDDSSEVNSESLAGDVKNVLELNPRLAPKEQSTNRRRSRNSRRIHGQAGAAGAGSESNLSHASSSSDIPTPMTGENKTRSGGKGKLVAAEGSVEEQQSRKGALQLSPVKEVRTPSPSRTSRQGLDEDFGQGASRSKAKGKAKQKKSSLSAVDRSENRTEPLVIQPNGLTTAAPAIQSPKSTAAPRSWQTQKRKMKHKKGSKSDTDLKQTNAAGGEFLPIDESLRKGG